MKSPQERKAASEQNIRRMGIGVFEGLPCVPSADEVQLKTLDVICSRAIAALLSTQAALERSQPQNQVQFFVDLMQKYDVANVLNAKEQRIVDGTFQQQDIADVVWEYECFWALAWALGLVDDLTDASSICDCEKAIHLVADCPSYEAFKQSCSLRDIEDILDMLDLYYRYHWACVQHTHIDSTLPIGNLNMEIVYERRRGLQWLIEDEADWHDISLHT